MTEHEFLEMNIADAIMERPFSFSVGNLHFNLYPITLGKMFLLSRLSEELGINDELMRTNPYLEAIRLCESRKDIVCQIISYHTFKWKDDLFNCLKVQGRAELLKSRLDNEELSMLLILTLSGDNAQSFVNHLGLDKDIKTRKKISALREGKGYITFGGRSIYGTLIDAACQRYGWKMDYVVWGISYVNLMMLFSDTIEMVHLNDEEMKKLHIFDNKRVINADDPNNKELIRELIND